MALSGTLETFSLPDVLRLLASTQKTGLLSLEGDRGIGRVWVKDGDIVAADSDRSGGEVDGVVFDLLRFEHGAFEFANGAEPDDDVEPRPVEEALTAAEGLLEEWRAIEAVVPSLDVWVALVPEIDADVTLAPDQWRVLAHVGAGVSAHRIAQHLSLGEFDVCRQLRDLVEHGLVEVDEDAVEPEQHDETDDAEEAVELEVVEVPEASHDAPPFEPPAFAASTIGSEEWSPPEPLGPDAITAAPWVDEPAPDPVAADPDVEDPDEDPVEDDPDEFLTQLAYLSPKAAAAIEATAEQDDDGDVDDELQDMAQDQDAPAAAGVEAAETGDAEDGELNQNLLLRFLSSTKQ